MGESQRDIELQNRHGGHHGEDSSDDENSRAEKPEGEPGAPAPTVIVGEPVASPQLLSTDQVAEWKRKIAEAQAAKQKDATADQTTDEPDQPSARISFTGTLETQESQQHVPEVEAPRPEPERIAARIQNSFPWDRFAKMMLFNILIFGCICLMVFPLGTTPQCGPPARVFAVVFVLIFVNLALVMCVSSAMSLAGNSTMLLVAMLLWLPVLIITSSTGGVFWPPYHAMKNGMYDVATFEATLSSVDSVGLPFAEVKDKNPAAIKLNGQFAINTTMVGYNQITIQTKNSKLRYCMVGAPILEATQTNPEISMMAYSICKGGCDPGLGFKAFDGCYNRLSAPRSRLQGTVFCGGADPQFVDNLGLTVDRLRSLKRNLNSNSTYYQTNEETIAIYLYDLDKYYNELYIGFVVPWGLMFGLLGFAELLLVGCVCISGDD